MLPGTADKIDLLAHAVLRAAAWPIETITPFSEPGLAAAAASIADADLRVLERRTASADALHSAVPTIMDRTARAYVLAVRRKIHRGSDPLPQMTPEVAEILKKCPEAASVLAVESQERNSLVRQRAEFHEFYAEVLVRQQCALYRLCDEPRFRKALIVANPGFARRWATHTPAPGEAATARSRRLNTTLMHYLLRAAGRPTPHGAWAGVAPVAPDDDGPAPLAVRPARPAHDVTISLQPFHLMLRAMTPLPRYRRGFPLRLSPTLHQTASGWQYERVTTAGITWASFSQHPVLDAIVAYFCHGKARPVDPLIEALYNGRGMDDPARAAFEKGVDILLDRQFLQPDLEIPPGQETVWDSLECVTARLVDPERSRWTYAISRIRTLCERLAAEFDALEPAGVESSQATIEAEVQALWTEVGLPGKVPGPIIRVDLRVPFEITWTSAFRAKVTGAVKELLSFHAADGGAEMFRRQSLQEVLDACQGQVGVPLSSLVADGRIVCAAPTAAATRVTPGTAPNTRPGLFAALTVDDAQQQAAHDYCAAWEHALQPVSQQPVHTLRLPAAAPSALASLPGSAGALVLRLADDDSIWVGPGRPQPAIFASRFGRLLGGVPGQEVSIFHDLRERAAAASRAGLVLTEIVGRDHMDSNAALRTLVTDRVLDPHSAPGGLGSLQLVLDKAQRPWLRTPTEPELLLPTYNSAASIGSSDPCSRLLWKLAMSHGWVYMSLEFPALRAERDVWGHLPRLQLPSAVLSRERWTIDGGTVARLSALHGAERYLAWRGLAGRLGLPALVHMQCGVAEAEILFPTESPLAVECLFERLAANARWLVLTELAGDYQCWPVRDAEGGHYLAELGITWYSENYYEQAICGGGDNATP